MEAVAAREEGKEGEGDRKVEGQAGVREGAVLNTRTRYITLLHVR